MVSETESKLDLLYLKWPRSMMKCVGLWILRKATPLLKRTSTIYWYFNLLTFGCYNASFVIGVKDLGDVDDSARIQHIAFLIYYLLILWRMLICRSKAMGTIIDKINDYEGWIRQQDENLIGVFEDNLRYNKKVYILTIMCHLVLVGSYVFGKIAETSTWKNEDFVPPEHLRLPEWFPFNEQKHYETAFVYHMVNACMAGFYGVACDVFFLALINFPVIQLRILGHQLEQFQEYCKNKEGVKNLKEQHDSIIRLVDEVNEVCKWLLFGDFCLKSYHISTELFILKRMQQFDAALVFTVSASATLFLQVFINYYHANELILESNNISTRIYMSSWYDESPETKQELYIIMIRSQKPLVLVIANLDFMSNILLMKIIKASYTYMIMVHI